MYLPLNNVVKFVELPDILADRWQEKVSVSLDLENLIVNVETGVKDIEGICKHLFSELGYSFATLVVEEEATAWLLRYIFYGDLGCGQIHVLLRVPLSETRIPSVSLAMHAADWQEREVEDLFGLVFEGHPRLGDFILHEAWPEGVNPMRKFFDASKPFAGEESHPVWQPHPIVEAPGAFMMPVGPVFSDYAESAHFLLETVGEEVIRIIPRFFFKYRGVEKIAEGKTIEEGVLLAERFSGTSAFAHSLAFCQAVENICGITAPSRARIMRVLLAELERFRRHVAAIGGICASTGLSVAASQAKILEERLLRLTCQYLGHRYLFGVNTPGGLLINLTDEQCEEISGETGGVLSALNTLQEMLRFTSSFLDRLEEVGQVTSDKALSYGLVGPVARASGIARDLRAVLPYAYYAGDLKFQVPCEQEGDGYARLRVLFSEAEQSASLISQAAGILPSGPVRAPFQPKSGCATGWVEAPRGAAFHWVRLDTDGRLIRYRVMTPSFVNWHGFHIAAEDFAFQDFPIIMATFGLSNAECDR